MKKFNRAFLAVVFILLLSFQTSYAQMYLDTEGTIYQDKAEFLTTIGIMEASTGEDFGINTEVTRSEFAVMAARALGLSSISDSYDKQVYTDVPPTHRDFFSINALFNAGIMLGHSDASFSPDEIVTYEEAVKTLLVVNGYYYIAEAKGGYPSGYLIVGNEKNLNSGVKLSLGQKMTKGDISLLLYNAILMNKLDIDTVGADVTFEEKKGHNILSDVYRIHKTTGIVNAFGQSSLASLDQAIPDGRVLIDETTYFIGRTAPVNYFGMKVDFFYQYDEEFDSKTLIYIMNKDNLNKVLTVGAKKILPATTTESLVYQGKDKKELKENIPSAARFIYNGKLLPSVVNTDLIPRIGNVTLIDNNLDNKYELVIIKEYKNYVVDGVVPLDGVIKTRFTNDTLTYDVNDPDSSIYFYNDGYEADIGALAKWNVISVMESKNYTGNHLVSVYISQQQISGTVAEVSNNDDGEYEITLDDGTGYILSNSFVERAEAERNGCSYPKAGDTATFYLDVFGDIEAKYIDAAANNNYGYLIGAVLSKEVDKNVKFKIFTLDQTIEIFEAASKVTVNGRSLSGESVMDDLRDSGDLTVIKPQLIIYSTNSSGALNEYKTAIDKTDDTSYITGEDEFVHSRKYDKSVRIYKQMGHEEGLSVNASTVFFDIPPDLSRERDYSIGRKFNIDDSIKPPFDIYNVGQGGVMGIIVARSAASTKFNTPLVVEKTASVVDDEGMPKTKIFFSGGTSVLADPLNITYESIKDWGYDAVKINNLKEGDIIQYNLKDNEIKNLRVLVKTDNIGDYRVDTDGIVDNGNQLAKVISVSDDKKFMVVNYKAGTSLKTETRQIAGGIRRYNSQTGRMEASAAADIQAGDTVFLNTFWLSTTMIVIFR